MTLKEVAKAAGVSHTTVSLVINNVEGSRVSESTRKRVLEAIKELDYNPNLIAKRLASGKTNSIGLFIPLASPIFRNYTIIEMVAGIQDVLNEKGLDLVLFSGGRNLLRDRPINQIVKQNTLDGLIIFNTRYTTQHFVNTYIKNLSRINFNFVILHYYWGGSGVNYVGVDYEKDALKGISYLISLGHRDIVLITGLPKALVTARVVEGYRRALENNNIGVQDGLIVHADYDYTIAYDRTKRIIEDYPSITAFFVGGYEMAPACLRALKDIGLNVPGDISIVAYVDTEIMALLDPPLTAIKIPYYDIGRKAAELLLDGNRVKQGVVFETELVIRGSTAEARSIGNTPGGMGSRG
jgi:LacI family transcriptional regulator